MKRFGQQIIFLAFGFLFCAALPALAQDAGMSDVELAEGHEGSNVAFTPGDELRFVPQSNGVVERKDSIVLQIHDFPMQRAQKPVEKANEKQPAKKDDSILTFNFLYYIIQKYKLQDIID